MEKLVSVIIPVYNVKLYLRACIDSVLNQTYHNLEILLIDDGSTDGSSQICDFYEQMDNRIKVIHQKNGGLSVARNVGLNNAHGEYYVFVDSDDYINEEMIERLYISMKATESDLAICNFVYVDQKGRKIQNQSSPIKNEILSTDEVIEKLFQDKNCYYVVAWNKLYKKELWSDIKYPVGHIHEDEAVVHRIFAKCKKVVTIDEKLYYYRQVPGSIMHSGNNEKRLDKYPALADRLIFLNNRVTEENIRKLAYQYWYNFLNDFFHFGAINKKADGLKRMKKSLIKVFYILVQCKLFTKKDALGIMIFLISPGIYQKLIYNGEGRWD